MQSFGANIGMNLLRVISSRVSNSNGSPPDLQECEELWRCLAPQLNQLCRQADMVLDLCRQRPIPVDLLKEGQRQLSVDTLGHAAGGQILISLWSFSDGLLPRDI